MILLALTLLGALGATAAGQAEPAGVCCSLVISMPTHTVSVGTDVKLKVSITNGSGEDASISDRQLILDVRDQQGQAVPKAARVSKFGPGGSFVGMVVLAGKSRDLSYSLNKRFDLSKPGQYSVEATWQIKDTTLRSNKVTLEIVP